jgi:hypothetical protein
VTSEGSVGAQFSSDQGLACRIPCPSWCGAWERRHQVEPLETLTSGGHEEKRLPLASLTRSIHRVLNLLSVDPARGHTADSCYACDWPMRLQWLRLLLRQCRCGDFDGESGLFVG